MCKCANGREEKIVWKEIGVGSQRQRPKNNPIAQGYIKGNLCKNNQKKKNPQGKVHTYERYEKKRGETVFEIAGKATPKLQSTTAGFYWLRFLETTKLKRLTKA